MNLDYEKILNTVNYIFSQQMVKCDKFPKSPKLLFKNQMYNFYLLYKYLMDNLLKSHCNLITNNYLIL